MKTFLIILLLKLCYRYFENPKFVSIVLTLLTKRGNFFPADYNECEQTSSACEADTSCVNTDGSFQCYCKDPNHVVVNGACEGMFIYLFILTYFIHCYII